MRNLSLATLALACLLPAFASAQTDASAARAEALEASSVWRAENRLDLAEEALWAVLWFGQDPEVLVELAEVAVGQRRPHAARWLVRDLDDTTRGYADLVGGLPPESKATGLQAAYALRADGATDEAEWALRFVRDSQAGLVELGYIASAQGRSVRAREFFKRAAEGEDEALATQAQAEIGVLPESLATDVYVQVAELRSAGETDRAQRMLRALLPFEERQRVALELGWTALVGGDAEAAREWLEKAAAGKDPLLAETAMAQLGSLAAPVEVEADEVTTDADVDAAADEALSDAEVEASAPTAARTEGNAATARAATMEFAIALRAEGQYTRAAEELERARGLGVGDQVIDMELGYTMLNAEDLETAKVHFQKAEKGPDADIVRRATELLGTLDRRIGNRSIAQARAYRTEKNWSMAAKSLQMAEEQGGDGCAIALEQGYLEADQGHPAKARKAFRDAAKCDTNDESRGAARAELRTNYRLFWGDLYADLFGWQRFLPPNNRSTNLVPTVRLRGYIHPIPKLDLDPYVFAQVSRDVASRGRTTTGFPQILADNTAMFGVGVLLRGWKRRVGLYAQIGPAINLLDDGRERVWLDARVAGFFAVAAPTCSPPAQMDAPGVRAPFTGCAEVYAEAVWVSRFENNVLTMGRGRIAFTALVTGPIAWQPIAEVRVLKDINNDYWNNLADAGVGMRWRLLVPVGLDLMLGVHGGSYFGLENKDPPPDPLGYAELRLQAATYIAF